MFEAGGVKECWDRLRWDGRAGGSVGGQRDGKVLVEGGVDRSVGGGMGQVVLEELAVGEFLRWEGWRSFGGGLLVVLGVFEVEGGSVVGGRGGGVLVVGCW